NLAESIAWSNDVYFYQLAHTLGPDRLIEAARALGVGAPTGIDLPGESPGYLGTPESVEASGRGWYGGSTVILGIGQGYLLTTPLQNARWSAAIATGALVTPRLGLAVGTATGGYTALPAPAPEPLPFADPRGPVRAGMAGALTHGTAARLARRPRPVARDGRRGAGTHGSAARLSGVTVPVAAKTGTAQDGSLPPDAYDNWLSAVAPADDPAVVVTAVVQGPGTGGNNVKGVVADALQHYA